MRCLIVALGLSAMAPGAAAAQIAITDSGKHCAQGFLAACASLRYIDFSNTDEGVGVLTIIVENTSDGSVEPGAYIKKLRLDLLGTLPAVVTLPFENYGLADAQYGFVSGGFFNATSGDTEKWKVKNEDGKELKQLPGFQKDLTVDDSRKEDEGGRPTRLLGVGEAVMLTVTFTGSLPDNAGIVCVNDPLCQGWTTEMKGLGDGSGKGYTTTPEPSTWLMLASGLALLGVAGLRRRRETQEP